MRCNLVNEGLFDACTPSHAAHLKLPERPTRHVALSTSSSHRSSHLPGLTISRNSVQWDTSRRCMHGDPHSSSRSNALHLTTSHRTSCGASQTAQSRRFLQSSTRSSHRVSSSSCCEPSSRYSPTSSCGVRDCAAHCERETYSKVATCSFGDFDLLDLLPCSCIFFLCHDSLLFTCEWPQTITRPHKSVV